MLTTHDEGELLEAVYELGQQDAVATDVLAERAGLSDTAVGEMIATLVDAGFVEVVDQHVRLTGRGVDAAVGYIRKHRLAERLLRDVIGLDWWKIHHEARQWENVISDEVEDRLVHLLGDPGTCPHGNPIPGSRNRPDQSRAVVLAEAPPGTCEVIRITEELEEDDEALRLLEEAGIIPGRIAEILGRESDGTVKVVGPVADTLVPPHVAARTYVLPLHD